MTKTVKIEHVYNNNDYVNHSFILSDTYHKICSYLNTHGHDWDGSPATFVITTDDLDSYENEPLTVRTCMEFELPAHLTCHILEFWLNPHARRY